MIKYYKILGISPNATAKDVKIAYRKKARLFHPDVNNQPEAEVKFIEISEAYTFLMDRLEDGVKETKRKVYRNPNSKPKDVARERREQAKANAARKAYEEYEAFKKTNYYKNEVALEVLGDNLMFYSYVAVCLIPAITLFPVGLLLGGFIAYIGKPLFRNLRNKDSNIRIGLLVRSIWLIVSSKVFRLFAFIALNLVVFLKVVMNTLVPLELTFGLLLLFIILGYFLVYKSLRANTYNRTLYGLVILPGLYQIFFVLNFFFSSSPVSETYKYRLLKSKTYSRYSNTPNYGNTPILVLEDGTYHKYLGMRFLWSPTEMQQSRFIEYHLEEGLFGIRVMKSYTFK